MDIRRAYVWRTVLLVVCTLVVAFHAFEDAPVAVAANRDERFDRPAKGPDIIDVDHGIVAPLDKEVGGTWIGYNDAGVLAAITNRWTEGELAAERSRGLLVRDALEAEDAEAAVRGLQRDLERRSYEGFTLVVADATAALLVEWDGLLHVSNLAPGIHVVTNTGVDDRFNIVPGREAVSERHRESARRLREALHPEPGESARSWLDRAGELIADHEYGVCVHQDGYGTRSSSLIALDNDGTATYRFAAGPPCRTAYQCITPSR